MLASGANANETHRLWSDGAVHCSDLGNASVFKLKLKNGADFKGIDRLISPYVITHGSRKRRERDAEGFARKRVGAPYSK